MAISYDSANIKVFDNKVLEQKLENDLITRLDMNQFITMDYDLAEAPGMVKSIRVYKGTGSVDDLAMGAGNSHDIGSEYEEHEYRVAVTQGRVPFYDEQQMADPKAIDKAVQFLGEALTNAVTTKVVAELANGTGTIATLDFDGIVDAIAEFPDEVNSDLYLLMSKKQYAALQKECKDQLSYVEDYVRRGYVGHIAGVPIFVSNAVDDANAFLASKSAITCFMKKGVEIERERDADTRKSTIFGRNVKVIALTDASKVAVFTEA
jgi:hypothetical protein